MRLFFPVAVAAVVIASCFLPWMTYQNSVITGVDTAGLPFGKPAYFHFLTVGLFLVFYLANRVWTRLIAFALTTLNLVWAFKNFIALPVCSSGNVQCPEKQVGLYLLLFASGLLFVAGMLAPAGSRKNKEAETVLSENKVL